MTGNNAFLANLEHPFKAELEAVRQIFLGASPDIQEGIKWNSLSFRTSEWFATFNWREKKQLQFVMHLGAKVKDQTEVANIPDPAGLLKWLAKDRALLNLEAGSVEAQRDALTALIQDWIKHV